MPANQKLVEGDILKLTIADDGTFIYKQIGPIERKQIIARSYSTMRLLCRGKRQRIPHTACHVTYFRIKGVISDHHRTRRQPRRCVGGCRSNFITSD